MDLLGDDDLLNLRKRTTDPGKMVQEVRAASRPIPGMNADLASWEGDAQAADCHICQRAATHRCEDCKKLACASHTWVMFGLCKSCASEEQVARWNEERQTDDKNWLEEP